MNQPVLQPVLAVGQQLGSQGIGRLIPGTANGARQRLGKEVALFPAVEALGEQEMKPARGELKAEVEALLGVAGPLCSRDHGQRAHHAF